MNGDEMNSCLWADLCVREAEFSQNAFGMVRWLQK